MTILSFLSVRAFRGFLLLLPSAAEPFNSGRVVCRRILTGKAKVVAPSVAVVGATGVVGEVMRQVLAER